MKHKYKNHHQVIYKGKLWFIEGLEYNPGTNIIYAYLDSAGKGSNYKCARLDELKPIGYALIKPSAGGKFRYHTVSWNNEKLQTSEPLDDKNHVKRMAKKYFPSFHIVDKTV